MLRFSQILFISIMSALATGCLESTTSICTNSPLIAIDPALIGKRTLFYDKEGYGKNAKFASQADIEIIDLGTGEYSVNSNASFPNGHGIHNDKLAICKINGFTIAQAGRYVMHAKSNATGLYFSNLQVDDEFMERLKLLRKWMPNLFYELNPFYQQVNGSYVEVSMQTKTADGINALIDALNLNPPPTKEWDDGNYSYQVK